MQKDISFIGYFEFYTKFSNLVQWAFLHYNPFKYFFLASTKIMGCQQQHMFQLYAKNQCCSLKFLSDSTSSSFWSNMMVRTTSIFLLALWPLILSPACRPPYKTPNSRSMDPLKYFWFMRCCHLPPVQNCSFAQLALTSFSFCQTNLTTLLCI